MLTASPTTLYRNAYYQFFTTSFAVHVLVFAGDFADDACDWEGKPECIPLPNSPCCTSSCKLRPIGSPCASPSSVDLLTIFGKESACSRQGVCTGKEDACVVPIVPNSDTKPKNCTVPGSGLPGFCVNGFCKATCPRYLAMGSCCSDGKPIPKEKQIPATPYSVIGEILPSDFESQFTDATYKNIIKLIPVAAECLKTGNLSSFICSDGAAPFADVLAHNIMLDGQNTPTKTLCGRGLGECYRATKDPALGEQEYNCRLLGALSPCKNLAHKTIDECEDLTRSCGTSQALPAGIPCNVNQECSSASVCGNNQLRCPNVLPAKDETPCYDNKGTCKGGKCSVKNPCGDKSSVNYCAVSTNLNDQTCCNKCLIAAPDTRCNKAGILDGVCNAAGLCDNSLCSSSFKKCTTGVCCNEATCDFKSDGTSCFNTAMGITAGGCKKDVCHCKASTDACCDEKSNQPATKTQECKKECYKTTNCDGKTTTCPSSVWTPGESCNDDKGRCGLTPTEKCQPPLCSKSSSQCDKGDCCDIPFCTLKPESSSCTETCREATTCTGKSADCPLTLPYLTDGTKCTSASLGGNSGVCSTGICVRPCDTNDPCCNKDTGLAKQTVESCGNPQPDCYERMCDGKSARCPPPTWNSNLFCKGGKCGPGADVGCIATTPTPPQVCFGPLSCDPTTSDPQCCLSTKCKRTNMAPCTLSASYAPKLGSSHNGECYDGQCLPICEKRGVCTNPGSECCDADCQPLQIGLTCGNGVGKCSARGTCEQTVCPLFQDSNSGTTLNGCECRDTLHACQVCCEPTANLTMLAQDPSNQCRPVGTFVSSPQVLSDAHISAPQTLLKAGTQCLTYGQCDTAGGVCKPNYTALTPPPTAATQPASTATGVTDAVTPKPIGKRVSPALLARVAYLAGKEGKPGATVPPTPSLRERFAQAGALQMIAMDVFYVLWKFCQACVLF